MRNQITYEWVCETLENCTDDDPDILDCSFFPTYKECLDYANGQGEPFWRIALVRTEGNEHDGITWRGYAYVNYSKLQLETQFQTAYNAKDGPNVPQKFHNEFQRNHK